MDFTGLSDVSVKSQNAEVLFEQQLVVDTRDEALGSSSKPVLEEEKITSGRNEEGASSSSNDSYPAGRNQSTPGSIPDTGTAFNFIVCRTKTCMHCAGKNCTKSLVFSYKVRKQRKGMKRAFVCSAR